MSIELYSRLKRRLLSILQPDQEPLDIMSQVVKKYRGRPEAQEPHFFSLLYWNRCAGNPICGVCLFPLSRGARPSNVDAEPDQWYLEDFGLKEVEASSSRGCKFCRNILKFALTCGAIDLSIYHITYSVRTLEVIKPDETSSRFVFMVPWTFAHRSSWPKGSMNRLCRGNGPIKMKSTADDQVLDQAKLWWETCVRKHKCQRAWCSYKPTRLLRLEHKSDDTVVWLVTVTQPVQYVTLSHRWSKETEEISLTSSNLHQRMEKGILATELPRLMQDTIYVLSRFRIEYLWIDSLCIIQGDDGDWRREAGSMASIYKNAAFTISATKSQGSHDSLFSDPADTATGARLGKLPGGITVRLEEEPGHPFYYGSNTVGVHRHEFLVNEALLGRGWVYQEVLLSPRTLFFLNHEIMWRCQEHRICQCARYDVDDLDGYDQNVTTEQGSTGTYYATRTETRQISSRTWANILEDYGGKEFTYPKDRLAALAGVAEEYAKETQWTYMCGLWKEEISQNLFWSRAKSDRLIKARPHGSENIPTWSWASTSCLPSDNGGCDANSVEFKSYHAVYNDKEENPFLGDVKNAVLTIEGDVFPAKLIRMSDYHKLSGIKLSDSRHNPGAKYGVLIMSYLVSIREDCVLDESILEKDVLLLHFPGFQDDRYADEGRSYVHSCLVLYCVDNISESYKRLGVLIKLLENDGGVIWTRRQLKLV